MNEAFGGSPRRFRGIRKSRSTGSPCSRRDFLLLAAASRIALAPRTARAAAAGASRVVHVRDPRATRWDYRTGWYGDFVDQAVVDTMTDAGVMELTGTRSRAEAWRALLPAYRPGQKVAIQINLNNAISGSTGQVIDALPQPVNGVVAGLRTIGVAEEDVWVYDRTNGWHLSEIPRRMIGKVHVRFRTPPGRALPDRRICNTLVRATHLVDMPIVNEHRMAGVTLSFKNHFGSIEGCDSLHGSTTLADPHYLPTHDAQVDIWSSRHFGAKTALVVGDALYGARKLAAAAGLGTFEHRDAGGRYARIDLVRKGA